MTPKSIALHYIGGGSDKVYNIQIKGDGNKFDVNVSYGRRGGPMTVGCKVFGVSLEKAMDVFNKLVAEKTAKGYQVKGGTVPALVGDGDKKPSGHLPQLLNPVPEESAVRFIDNWGWCAQEKYDGHHKMIWRVGSVVQGINKKGQLVPLPETVVDYAQMFDFDFLIDCEQIGDKFYAFDILEVGAGPKFTCFRDTAYENRYKKLKELFSISDEVVEVVETAFTWDEKRAMFARLKRDNREGIVFKRTAATFTPGRPNSGGDMLKCKFWATLSAVVLKVNEKNSIECGLYTDKCDSITSCGNVTTIGHKDIGVGEVVELRYLYALKSSGILYQPNYLGKRDDVDPEECTTKQLKYKSETE